MNYAIHATILLALLTVNTLDVSANSSLAYEGRGLYVSHCQLCHGTRGKGDGPLAKAMKISPADLPPPFALEVTPFS